MPLAVIFCMCNARSQMFRDSCYHSLLFPKLQSESDDFLDLDEVFAEYFMSESDELVAYPSSMIHCGGAANDMDMDRVGSSIAMDQRKPTSCPGNNAFLAVGGNKAVFSQQEKDRAEDAASQSPPTKKFKQEGTDSVAQYPFENPDWRTKMSQYQQMLNQDQDQQSPGKQEHIHLLQPHHARQLQQILKLQAQADSCGSLPVVGVVTSHLGDVDAGDSVPTTAQSTPDDPMVEGQNHDSMEEYGSWAVSDHEKSADRRQKEKNRKYAKQFRVRTKSMFESLREELENLKKENTDLRMIVQGHIPDHAMQTIAECSSVANPLLFPS